MHSTLSTTGGSGDWKQRIEALQMVRSLLIAGAGQFEELTSQVGTHLTQTLSYSSPFLPQLKALEYPFESCVKDLRSQVSTEHILFCLLDGDICHLVLFSLHGKCSGCERMLHHPGIHVPAASSQGDYLFKEAFLGCG